MSERINSNLSSGELIALLEKEMAEDVRGFDVPPSEEHNIDFKLVEDWYLRTEKVVRVLGNLFTSPTYQPINQLRYAGHHILKAQVAKSDDEKQSNLVEAFKHCKRGLYDAFDFYICELNEYYRSLLPYLVGEQAKALEKQIGDLVVDITELRNQAQTRIAYYSGVQESFIKGLRLIEGLNDLQREAGISASILKSRSQLVAEKAVLNNTVTAYKQGLDERANATKLLVAVMTFVGLIASAAATIIWSSSYDVTISNPVVLSAPSQKGTDATRPVK